jgi:hypothetical protein
MLVKKFLFNFKQFKKGFTTKSSTSRYKQEINLLLTSVYKVYYPKQWSYIMSKMNLRLVFSSYFNFIGVRSFTEELVKTCVRERLSVLSGLT